MKFSKELEARLAKLPAPERKRVLAVAKRHAKLRLSKMLDQTVLLRRKNKDGQTLQ